MKADTLKRPALDLQLFAEEPVVDATPSTEDVEAFLESYLEDSGDSQDPVVPETLEGPQETPEQDAGTDPLSYIPDKYKTAQNPVEALAKAYTEAEKKISEYGGDKSLTQKQIGELSTQVQAMATLMEQQLKMQQKPTEPTVTPLPAIAPGAYKLFNDAGKELTKEEWRDFYDENPDLAIANLANSIVQPIMKQYIEPMAAELSNTRKDKDWSRKVFQAQKQFGADKVDAMFDEIQEVFKENPGLQDAENSIAVAYQVAVAKKGVTEPVPVTADSVRENKEMLRQLASDPKSRPLLVKFMQESMAGRQASPTVMGNQAGGGFSPASPIKPIKNVNDAGVLAANYLKKIASGGK